jgi:hypothetical protein
VTTHATSASDAANCVPIDGSTRLTMSLAMTVTSIAGISTASRARAGLVRPVVVDMDGIRGVLQRG